MKTTSAGWGSFAELRERLYPCLPRHPLPQRRGQRDLPCGERHPSPATAATTAILRRCTPSKAAVEQAYEKQRREIAGLEDFVARNKARAATANMARSRQKKLDRMDVIELPRGAAEVRVLLPPGPDHGPGGHGGQGLVLGYDAPLTRPMDLLLERNQKIAVKGVNGLGKSTLLKNPAGHYPAHCRRGGAGPICGAGIL